MTRQFICLVFWMFYLTKTAVGQQTECILIDRETELPLEFVQVVDSVHKKVYVSDIYGKVYLPVTDTATIYSIQFTGYRTIRIASDTLKKPGYRYLMEYEIVSLPEIVFSGSRWQQRSSDLPYKIHSVSPSQVWNRQPQTAADLLGISGRVFIQKSQQGGGSPMIRGFATNRLLYSVDGIRMNTAIFRSGNIQNVISLDGFAMEKTEILFGPASVMYGSDAIGGVMAFQTLQPFFDVPKPTGNAVVRHSTANGEWTGHADIRLGGNRVASVTSMTMSRFGHLKMGRHGPEEYRKPYLVVQNGGIDSIVANPDPDRQTPSEYKQFNIMQKIRWLTHKKHWLEYALHYSTTSSFDRYDRHIRYRNGLPRYAEWKYGPQQWMMHMVTWQNNMGTKWYDQMTIRAANQRFGESRIEREIYKTIRYTRTEKVDAWSVNADFIKRLGTRWTLTYGAESVLNDVTSTGTDTDVVTQASFAGPSRYPQAVWHTSALFSSAQYKASEKWSFNTGVRWSSYNTTANFDTTFYPLPFTRTRSGHGAVTGQAGLVLRPTTTSIFQVNLSSGFRAPNVDDLGKIFDSAPGNVTVPNPSLRSEYAWNAEMGWVQLVGDWLRIDLSAYTTLLENALVKRPFTLNGQDSILYNGTLSRVEAIQNAAFAYVRGIQAGIELRPGRGFMVTSQYNVQAGTEELEDGSTSPARQAAPNFGVSQLSWKKGKWYLSVICEYSASRSYDELSVEEQIKPELYARDSQGRPFSPAWTIWHLNLSWQWQKYIQLFAGVENLTDLRYRPYSSGLAGAGRQVTIAVRTSW